MDLDQAHSLAQIVNTSLEAFGKIRSFLTNPGNTEQKAAAEAAMIDAEEKIKIAKAQVGKAFGYQLCKCTFPPTVRLTTGFNDLGDETSRCPGCGQEYPLCPPDLRWRRGAP
jgi:hypothetical protein